MNSTTSEFLWWGFDIGGANIKYAAAAIGKIDSAERLVCSVPFALWKHQGRLPSQLRSIFASLPGAARLAITMTGELADCFSSRRSGVAAIVDAIEQAAEGRVVLFYNTSGGWLPADQAKKDWLAVAAANWHAIANYSVRMLDDGNGFLIDIGSTTTDIVPVRCGRPAAIGRTDFDRLRCSELYYAGVGRTPVCNLLPSFQINDVVIPAASEFFATIEDALVITEDVVEDASNRNTADGRPLTKSFSGMRLARMVCEDAERLGQEAIKRIASQTKWALNTKISDALQSVVQANPDLPLHFVVSGQGDWLAEKIVDANFGSKGKVISWSSRLGSPVSKSAAAYAVAVLAHEASSSQRRLASSNIGRAKDRLPLRVIKIGGSLFDWQSAPQQIGNWLSQQTPMTNIWITGGGPMVDLVRDWHQRFPLQETTAHHVCLDLMSVTVRLAGTWFPAWPITQQFHDLHAWAASGNILFDSARWLREQTSLPESWRVSSDSCAAFIAQHLLASELVMLKSRNADEASDWQRLVDTELVDESLPKFSQGLPVVRIVNMRDEKFAEVLISPGSERIG